MFMEFLGQESDIGTFDRNPNTKKNFFDENKNSNILVLEQWRKNAVNCIVLISRKSTKITKPTKMITKYGLNALTTRILRIIYYLHTFTHYTKSFILTRSILEVPITDRVPSPGLSLFIASTTQVPKITIS